MPKTTVPTSTMAASDEPGTPLGVQLPALEETPPSLPDQVLSVASARDANTTSAAPRRQDVRLSFIGTPRTRRRTQTLAASPGQLHGGRAQGETIAPRF